MWLTNETERDPLFCNIHLVLSKEWWELAIQPETDGLFRALTSLDKFSLSLPSGYSEVWAKSVKTDLTNWGYFWIIEIRMNYKNDFILTSEIKQNFHKSSSIWFRPPLSSQLLQDLYCLKHVSNNFNSVCRAGLPDLLIKTMLRICEF